MKLNNDQFIQIMKIDLKNGIVPFLAGEPGIGKSSIVKSLAASMDSKVFVVMCNQMADKADLTGARLMPTEDGSYEQQFFPHHKVKSAIQYAKENPRSWVLLMLDEINRTTPDITSAALTLSTERELGNEELPSNVKIVVAGNNKGNVTALDEASLSRFSIYNVEPEASALMQVLGDRINPHIKAVLTKYPQYVFEKSTPNTVAVDGDDDDDDSRQSAQIEELLDSGEEMLQLTTPRTIEFANNWLNDVDDTLLSELVQTQVRVEGRDVSLFQEVMEGKLGNTNFTKHLVDEVISSLNSGAATQAPSVSVPKPGCYDDLKAVTSIDELNDLIQDLNDHEKSGALIYSLYEDDDNTVLIQQLAAATGAVERDHMATLVQLASHSKLVEDNVSTLFGTNTQVGNNMQNAIGFFMNL